MSGAIKSLQGSTQMISDTAYQLELSWTVFSQSVLIAIEWTIDVWCIQLLRIVQFKDHGDCLLIEIALKIVFASSLFIGIAWTTHLWWLT